MKESAEKIGILKTLWGRENDGRWGISGAKGLTLTPQSGFDADFFKFESEIELLTQNLGPKKYS
jgi:hypothetical protein